MSLKGLFDNGDGTYWAKNKKTVSAAIRAFHTQGYSVRSKRLSKAEGGGHEIRIIGERKVRVRKAARGPGRNIRVSSGGGYRYHGGRIRHTPARRAGGHTPAHTPAGAHRSGGGSIAGEGYTEGGSLFGFGRRRPVRQRRPATIENETFSERQVRLGKEKREAKRKERLGATPAQSQRERVEESRKIEAEMAERSRGVPSTRIRTRDEIEAGHAEQRRIRQEQKMKSEAEEREIMARQMEARRVRQEQKEAAMAGQIREHQIQDQHVRTYGYQNPEYQSQNVKVAREEHFEAGKHVPETKI